MPSPGIKVLEKKKLSSFEYYVKIRYKGRDYSDAFSLPGKKKFAKNYKDKKSIAYIITMAMINAVEKQTAEAEEVKDVNSQDNSEG